MSDWGAVHSTVKAANAGLDQDSGAELDKAIYFGTPLKDALAKDEVSKARLDEMAKRVLTGHHRDRPLRRSRPGDDAADRLCRPCARRPEGGRGGHRAAPQRGRPAAARRDSEDDRADRRPCRCRRAVGRRFVAGAFGRRRADRNSAQERPGGVLLAHDLSQLVAAEGDPGADAGRDRHLCRRQRSGGRGGGRQGGGRRHRLRDPMAHRGGGYREPHPPRSPGCADRRGRGCQPEDGGGAGERRRGADAVAAQGAGGARRLVSGPARRRGDRQHPVRQGESVGPPAAHLPGGRERRRRAPRRSTSPRSRRTTRPPTPAAPVAPHRSSRSPIRKAPTSAIAGTRPRAKSRCSRSAMACPTRTSPMPI